MSHKISVVPAGIVRILVVTDPDGEWAFSTLDDCFGMDRIKDWATQHGLDFHTFTKG